VHSLGKRLPPADACSGAVEMSEIAIYSQYLPHSGEGSRVFAFITFQ
jgi:hypothetical protein